MKKQLLLNYRLYLFHFLTGILFINHSAIAQDFDKIFSGSINNKYDIRMHLQQQDGKLTGNYSYVKVGKPIQLVGQIDAEQVATLKEFDENDQQTGLFKGQLTDNNSKFAGTWSKPDGQKAMPFLLVAEAGHASANPSLSALIKEKQVVLERQTAPEHKKTATLRYPFVTGLQQGDEIIQSETARQQIQAILDPSAVFSTSQQEWQADNWLDTVSYHIDYNDNNILAVTFQLAGSGAYPDVAIKHLVINLKAGTLLGAQDIFQAAMLQALADEVNKALQAAIAEKAAEEQEDIEMDEYTFQVKHLDNFSVNQKGVTFFYDFGFPHAMKALEPKDDYSFSYQELKTYIQPNGLLGIFIQ